MSYDDHFKLADDMIDHLNTVIDSISDPFIKSRYTGFVAVASVTVYELAIKEIFFECARKNIRYSKHLRVVIFIASMEESNVKQSKINTFCCLEKSIRKDSRGMSQKKRKSSCTNIAQIFVAPMQI